MSTSPEDIETLLELCPRTLVTALIAQRDRLERERDEARRELAILRGRQEPIIIDRAEREKRQRRSP